MTQYLNALKEVRLLAESLAKQGPSLDPERDFSDTQDWLEFATAMERWVETQGLTKEWHTWIYAQLGIPPVIPPGWGRDKYGKLKETTT
jgi:hypothetical protein